MIDIVICTDDNYLMPSGVLICSVCENNKADITFHIISLKPLSETTIESFNGLIHKYNKQIKYYDCDLNKLDILPIKQPWQLQHVTIASYLRLFISKVLPTGLDKVLYLDCDIVVTDNLEPMWSIDITNYAIGCVPDAVSGDISYINNLRYNHTLGYFNAGVLLVNLKYWRERKLLDQYLDYAKHNAYKLRNCDQDVMNYVLREQKLFIPLRYNVQYHFFLKEPLISWEYEDELTEARQNPCIVHYTTSRKPWIKPCTHPLAECFHKYKNLTEWKSIPDVDKRNLKFRVKDILHKLNIYGKNPYKDNRLIYNE